MRLGEPVRDELGRTGSPNQWSTPDFYSYAGFYYFWFLNINQTNASLRQSMALVNSSI